MTMLRYLAPVMVALAACGENNTPSSQQAPGAEKSLRTEALETGAKTLQDRQPLDAVSAYLDGFHFYNGDMDGQMEAHHYATVLNDDVMQAIIYDGNTADAKLMGVEYIISARLFEQLPEDEKRLWHSHRYEVKSGALIAPGLPAAAETALMKKLAATYGKTIHTWHTDRGKELPYGVPALMMGFTADGQLDPKLRADRDRRFGVDSNEIARRRADFPDTPIAPGADAWQRGEVIQFQRSAGPGEHARDDSADTTPASSSAPR